MAAPPKDVQPDNKPTAKSPSGPAPQGGGGGAPAGGKNAGPAKEQNEQKTRKDAETKQNAPKAPPADKAGDDLDRNAGGGAVMEAEADEERPAEPARAPNTDSVTGTDAPKSEKKKGKAADPQQEAKKLAGQARAKANSGDCAGSLKLRNRVQKIDPSYYDKSVKNDPDYAKRCSKKPGKAQRREADEATTAPAAPDSKDATPAQD